MYSAARVRADSAREARADTLWRAYGAKRAHHYAARRIRGMCAGSDAAACAGSEAVTRCAAYAAHVTSSLFHLLAAIITPRFRFQRVLFKMREITRPNHAMRYTRACRATLRV